MSDKRTPPSTHSLDWSPPTQLPANPTLVHRHKGTHAHTHSPHSCFPPLGDCQGQLCSHWNELLIPVQTPEHITMRQAIGPSATVRARAISRYACMYMFRRVSIHLSASCIKQRFFTRGWKLLLFFSYVTLVIAIYLLAAVSKSTTNWHFRKKIPLLPNKCFSLRSFPFIGAKSLLVLMKVKWMWA